MKVLKKAMVMVLALGLTVGFAACSCGGNKGKGNGGGGGSSVNTDIGAEIDGETVATQEEWNAVWQDSYAATNLTLNWTQVGEEDGDENSEDGWTRYNCWGFERIADGKEYSEEHLTEYIEGGYGSENGSNICYYGVIDGVGYEWRWDEEDEIWMWRGGWADPIGTGYSAIYSIEGLSSEYEDLYAKMTYDSVKKAYVMTETIENPYRSRTITTEIKFKDGKLAAGKITEVWNNVMNDQAGNETWAFTITYGNTTVGELPPLDPAGQY